MIRFLCSRCGKKCKAPAGTAGRKVDCPRCRKVLEVPFVFPGDMPPVRRSDQQPSSPVLISRPSASESSEPIQPEPQEPPAEVLADSLHELPVGDIGEWRSPARQR